jgi:hypothetical protein
MNTAVRIQSVGMHIAKPASSISVGDVLVWNFGYTSKVTRIVSETPAFVTIEEQYDGGKLYERRLKKSRLVAYTTKINA